MNVMTALGHFVRSQRSSHSPASRWHLVVPAALGVLLVAPWPASAYVQTNLVSDIPGLAAFTDPNLVNPWGMSSGPTSPIWVSNNGSSTSTLYDGAGQPQPLVVTIPPPFQGGPPAGPTGQVFNPLSSNFSGDRFIFATEQGTIAGWQVSSGTSALNRVIQTGAVYKGLALANDAGTDKLYAANFSQGLIDAFDSNYSSTFGIGSFTDPGLPSGYAPFNVQEFGGELYVTYALVDPANPDDDLPGAGHGFLDIYTPDGSFVRRAITQGALDSPWGIALAPSDFGAFSNDLLVGNFGDGRINAFDPTTFAFLGALTDENGDPIVIDGLWGLRFGNGGLGGDPNTLYFTAGIEDEQHGLFGSITAGPGAAVPEPGSLALLGMGALGLVASRRRRR